MIKKNATRVTLNPETYAVLEQIRAQMNLETVTAALNLIVSRYGAHALKTLIYNPANCNVSLDPSSSSTPEEQASEDPPSEAAAGGPISGIGPPTEAPPAGPIEI